MGRYDPSKYVPEFIVRILLLSVTLAASFVVSGCSSRQAYASGQAWQRNECNKLVDMQERQRCMSKANASYESYQRQAEEAKSTK